MSSCTAGLWLYCIRYKKGDEVIVQLKRTLYSSLCRIYRAKAVFADIDIETGNISINDIKRKISKNKGNYTRSYCWKIL